MQIKIEIYVNCLGYLPYKSNVAIFVGQESDIDKLHTLLCEINPDFKTKKNLIKVLPNDVKGIEFLDNICEYCGRIDLNHEQVAQLKTQVGFVIYQQFNENYDWDIQKIETK